MMKKSVLGMLGVVALVVMVGSGCTRTGNTADEQSAGQETPVPVSDDAVTYVDPIWGYRLAYPVGWRMKVNLENREGNINERISSHSISFYSSDEHTSLEINMFPKNDNDEGLINWLQNNQSHWFWEKRSEVVATNSTVADHISFAQVLCSGPEAKFPAIVWTQTDNVVYSFVFNGRSESELTDLLQNFSFPDYSIDSSAKTKISLEFFNTCPIVDEDNQ